MRVSCISKCALENGLKKQKDVFCRYKEFVLLIYLFDHEVACEDINYTSSAFDSI